MCLYILFLFYCYGDHRNLHVLTHSFPTRGSSDLAVLALGQVQFLRRQQLFERSERVLAVELGIGRIPQFALARGASAILEATTAGDFRERGLPQDRVRRCRRPALIFAPAGAALGGARGRVGRAPVGERGGNEV